MIKNAEELVLNVKTNLLKPMYDGINAATRTSKEELLTEVTVIGTNIQQILGKINFIEQSLAEIKDNHAAWCLAIKNIKWD